MQLALENTLKHLVDAQIVIDESFKGTGPKRELSTYLRQAYNSQGETRRIATVRYRKSHTDNLVQVADMFAEAIAHLYETGDPKYSHLIGKKRDDVRVYP